MRVRQRRLDDELELSFHRCAGRRRHIQVHCLFPRPCGHDRHCNGCGSADEIHRCTRQIRSGSITPPHAPTVCSIIVITCNGVDLSVTAYRPDHVELCRGETG